MSHRDVLGELNLAVLYGGTSGEREVSLKSARTVIGGLESGGYTARTIDTAEAAWWRQLEGVDLAFNIQHGGAGEDGTTQGLLASLGVVGTGSGVLGSALAMDKVRCKRLWLSAGLPTADFEVVDGDSNIGALLDSWGEFFVKPAREGSSLGMARVSAFEQGREAIAAALRHDAVVMAEALIDGPEYTVAILGDRALPPIRIQAANVFYDYEAKYQAHTTEYHIPSGLDAQDEQTLCDLALAAFEAVDASVWGRVDVMRSAAGEFYLLEVNTVPGMTDHSLVPMAAKAEGMDIPTLVEEILWLSWTGACSARGVKS
jgi:D-alanine-D-alanine ligase